MSFLSHLPGLRVGQALFSAFLQPEPRGDDLSCPSHQEHPAASKARGSPPSLLGDAVPCSPSDRCDVKAGSRRGCLGGVPPFLSSPSLAPVGRLGHREQGSWSGKPALTSEHERGSEGWAGEVGAGPMAGMVQSTGQTTGGLALGHGRTAPRPRDRRSASLPEELRTSLGWGGPVQVWKNLPITTKSLQSVEFPPLAEQLGDI